MRAADKTYFILKPSADPKRDNGVVKASYDGIEAGLKARGVPADRIVGHTDLHTLVRHAEGLSAPVAAALVVPGGNAFVMYEHIKKTSNVHELTQRTRALLATGATYIGICAGSILAARDMTGHGLVRRALPQEVRDELKAEHHRSGRESVRNFIQGKEFDGDITPKELATALPKAQSVPMLGLAAGVHAEAYAYFGAHAGHPMTAVPEGIEAPMRLRDGSLVNVPNYAGPRLSGEGEVLATYEELGHQPAGITRVKVGDGTVTQSAVHPEWPTDDPQAKADRDRVFDEVFEFDRDS